VLSCGYDVAFRILEYSQYILPCPPNFGYSYIQVFL
jgi:hypothetical protein